MSLNIRGAIKIKTIHYHDSRDRETKNQHITCRVTPSQKELMEAAALESGMSLSEAAEQAVSFWLEFYEHDPVRMTMHKDRIAAILGTLK